MDECIYRTCYKLCRTLLSLLLNNRVPDNFPLFMFSIIWSIPSSVPSLNLNELCTLLGTQMFIAQHFLLVHTLTWYKGSPGAWSKSEIAMDSKSSCIYKWNKKCYIWFWSFKNSHQTVLEFLSLRLPVERLVWNLDLAQCLVVGYLYLLVHSIMIINNLLAARLGWFLTLTMNRSEIAFPGCTSATVLW